MPSKRCLACSEQKQIEDRSLFCDDCEEQELDILMSVYAYIHCSGSGFSHPKDILGAVESNNNIKLTQTILRSWASKEWLDKNQKEELAVPDSVKESIEAEGFSVTPNLIEELQDRRDYKPEYDPNMLKGLKSKEEDGKQRFGMAYMEKMRSKK